MKKFEKIISEKLYLIGNSHTAAIVDACKQNSISYDFRHSSKISISDEDGREQSIRLSRLSDILKSKNKIFTFIGGNAHNVLGMKVLKQPFDFVHPDFEHMILNPTARVLPYMAVRGTLERRGYRWLSVLKNLHEAVPERIVQFEMPPPIRDNEYIAKAFYNKLEEGERANFEVAPPSLRFKLWRTLSDIYRDICMDKGIRYIPVPAASQDNDGFLREEYWSDPSHANALYGELVLMQIEEIENDTSL